MSVCGENYESLWVKQCAMRRFWFPFFKTPKSRSRILISSTFEQDLLIAKAKNSHIHAQIQHGFSISKVNSPIKETWSRKEWGGEKAKKENKIKKWKGITNSCQKSEWRVEIYTTERQGTRLLWSYPEDKQTNLVPHSALFTVQSPDLL